jgi:hypothetical protein
MDAGSPKMAGILFHSGDRRCAGWALGRIRWCRYHRRRHVQYVPLGLLHRGKIGSYKTEESRKNSMLGSAIVRNQ